MNVQTDTLPKLLHHLYRKYGTSKVALREKDRGIWKEYTWADYYSIVKWLSLAFLQMGLKRDDKIAILGENNPHIYWCELAAHANRATAVGIFSDCTSPEVKYFVQHSDSTFVLCQDQEQVDKFLEIKDEIPLVKKVIYWEEKGLWSYDDPLLMTVEEMLEIGKNYDREHPHIFDRMIDETHGDDIGIFFYTSGTTGLPKAAMVNQRSLVGMGDTFPFFVDTDESLSYLPIAWSAEQIFNIVCSLLYGFTINFPEKQETVQENIREIGPTYLTWGSRAWEGYIKAIRVKISNASWVNRLCFNASIKVAFRVNNKRREGKEVAAGWRVVYWIADKFVFRPLRDRLGMSRIRFVTSGGAPISPDVFNYFHSIGIPLLQLYGTSEAGPVSIQSLNQFKPETCGEPLKGIEVKITDEGEVLVRSPYLFVGYYKDPEKFSELVENGWYHTGDFGRFDDDGQLIIMDRMVDLRPIAGNKFFSPQFSEVRLRFSPFIKDAVVSGNRTFDHTVAIIVIDYRNVGEWAEAHHIPYTTFVDLSQKEETIELIKKEIWRVNEYLPEWTQIKRFVNLHKEFDADEAELTRTQKVRRDFFEDKYKEIIESLFSSKDSIDVKASVTYRDGTKTELERSLFIKHVRE